MNVLIYHSYLPPDATPDELDVLEERDFYKENLETLGYKVYSKPFPFDYSQLARDKEAYNPVFLVNLVETIYNDGRLIHVAPAFFDYLGIPYTGCSSEVVYLTSNKLTTKLILKANGINMPDYLSKDNFEHTLLTGEKYILKSVWEHASVSIDENVTRLMDDKEALMAIITDSVKKGKEVYADQYIEGREFNISILGGKEGPQVLLPAEMCFYNYPEGKLKVVGYRAKWVEDSFEYENTRRTFDFAPEDAPLLEELKQICLRCWKAFGLKGYARVDFRVDKNNVPYVLEINANPCISPSSGFISAAVQTGLSMKEVIDRIIYDTYNKI